MTLRTRPRRSAATLTAMALAAGALLSPTIAAAADGPAPAPVDYRVIAGVHADAVSTFVDDGQLSLGSKADVAEGNGTRFSADEIWFHLEDTSQQRVEEGFEFIAEPGSAVWVAPESNPGAGRLWPGFNTESVPAGAIEDDETTFTLTGVEGPGEVEVFTGGGAQEPQRLWSSADAEFRSFEIARTHMHANWAFTAAGTYQLHVEASAVVDGLPQSAATAYTIVVGALPAAAATTTSLSAATTSLVAGESVELTAEVSPASAVGHVEFRDGAVVLGHETLDNGTASLEATFDAVGTHELTAAFVPAVSNHADASISSPVSVNVTDGSGVEFGISGIAASYEVGDFLSARVVGNTLHEGQVYSWSWRPIGATSAYVLRGTGGQEATGLMTFPIDMSYDDYEVRVAVRDGGAVVSESSWVPLHVNSDVVAVTGSFPEGELFLGDDLLLEVDSAPAAGDVLRLVYRFASGGWSPLEGALEPVDENTMRVMLDRSFLDATWAVQTVRDGVVVAQSEPFDRSIPRREVIVQGMQSVYRVGQTLRLSAEVYPPMEGMTYVWSMSRFTGGVPLVERIVLKETTDAADLELELPIEAHHDGWSLNFSASIPEGHPNGPISSVAEYSKMLTVSDSDPDSQLFFFGVLGDHYHQGYDIDLSLIADPVLADGDTISWEWKWPGSEWTTLPAASGLNHMLVAEQALHGVQVRATLRFEGGDAAPMTTAPVEILVDDHGSAARQQVSVTGPSVTRPSEAEAAATVTDGVAATFTAELTDTTVLTSFQWFMKPAGAVESAPIDGATSETYELIPEHTLDGAELSVAVVKPDGTVAYGPSVPVVLTVEANAELPLPAEPDLNPDDAAVDVSSLTDAPLVGLAVTGGGVPLTGLLAAVLLAAVGGAIMIARRGRGHRFDDGAGERMSS